MAKRNVGSIMAQKRATLGVVTMGIAGYAVAIDYTKR